MVQPDTFPRLLVVGVHVKTEAYPNTLFRLRDLAESNRFRYEEINVPLWRASSQRRHGRSRLTRDVFRAAIAHILVLGRYLAARQPDVLYIPYPAVFVLLLLSALPRSRCPRRMVADAFISLYDTIVLDRRLLRAESRVARALWRIEGKALATADQVIVDTPQNARFLSDLFRLPEAKFNVTPLATDEIHFRFTPYQARTATCRVVFFGALAPLHGVMTILEAARMLAHRSDIQFSIIGDGQESDAVSDWLRQNRANVNWTREWQSSAQIAEALANADICLGIFGKGQKAQRVCPYKLYACAAVGRAIVTGDTEWARSIKTTDAAAPFSLVPVGDSKALAMRIVWLAGNPQTRETLANNARRFYDERLANWLGTAMLEACLLRSNATASAA